MVEYGAGCGREGVDNTGPINWLRSPAVGARAPSMGVITVATSRTKRHVSGFLHARLGNMPGDVVCHVLHGNRIQIGGGHVGPRCGLRTNSRIHVPPIHITRQRRRTISPRLRGITTLTSIVLCRSSRVLILGGPSNATMRNNDNLDFNIVRNLQTLHPRTQFLRLIRHLSQSASNILLMTGGHSTLHSLRRRLHRGKVRGSCLTLIHNR